MIFMDKFVYLRSGPFHHVISAIDHYGDLVCHVNSDLLREAPCMWFYFKTDMDICEKNIHYDPITTRLYVVFENNIHKYCHSTNNIDKFSVGNENSKILMINTDDDYGMCMFHIKDNNLWIDGDDDNIRIELNGYELLKYTLDADSNQSIEMILIDMDDPRRYISCNDILFVNVRGLKYYKLMKVGFVYYDENTLFLCTGDELVEPQYGTSEIDKISTAEDTFYIYMFNNLPQNIHNVTFTDKLILLNCGDKFYYHALGSNDISLSKFTEIVIQDNVEENLLNKYHIIYPSIIFNGNIVLGINVNSNKLEKILSIAEMLPNNHNFNIEQLSGTKIISYGDGPKREFMDSAVLEFADKYLITHNRCCEFNLDAMKNVLDDQLLYMGKMLQIIICHNRSHLQIRLPLSLLTALVQREPTISELEYFAKIEDPESFKNIFECKHNIKMINETGRNDYKQCLTEACKYYYGDEKFKDRTYHISKYIAMGMLDYDKIKNLSIMNLPTLDYYLSGDYVLNRNLLFKNLKVFSPPNTSYNNKLIEIIKNLSDSKLSDLLKNWSGWSIVKKNYNYTIHVYNDDKNDSRNQIFFGTCGTYINISEKLLNDPELGNQLVDLLTTPMNTMVDN